MKWTTKENKWRRWFALLPVCTSNEGKRTCVWCQWYWSRPDGDCTQVSFTDPTIQAASAPGGE